MTLEATNATYSEYGKGCPYFALLNDPDTSLLFPSSMGHCHRAHPPAPVQLDHQENYCLTAQHTTCPIFLRQGKGALPAAIQGEAVAKPPRRWTGLKFLGGIIILGLLAWLGVWGSGFIVNQPPEPEIPTQAAVAVLPEITATHTKTPTETAVPTDTPAPTDTPTPPPTVTPIPTIALPPTFTPVPPPITAVIDEAQVNVHTGPHNSYPILQAANQIGTRFDIVGQTETGEWWQVCCLNGKTGWIANAGVTVNGDTSEIPVIPLPTPQVAILASRLNVRSGPSVDYPIVGLIEEGGVYDLVGRLNDGTWWQLCCLEDNETGWVINEGVEVWGDVELVPVVAVPPLPTSTEEP
ncbi:MAG: SH3 domain-containing protein [Chloroflexota bacterium]